MSVEQLQHFPDASGRDHRQPWVFRLAIAAHFARRLGRAKLVAQSHANSPTGAANASRPAQFLCAGRSKHVTRGVIDHGKSLRVEPNQIRKKLYSKRPIRLSQKCTKHTSCSNKRTAVRNAHLKTHPIDSLQVRPFSTRKKHTQTTRPYGAQWRNQSA